jgi:glyoxylase-like metal-dependent hydrolase (beta-lactamase superfamily II)
MMTDRCTSRPSGIQPTATARRRASLRTAPPGSGWETGSIRRGQMRALFSRFKKLRGWSIGSLIVSIVVIVACVIYVRDYSGSGIRVATARVPRLGPRAMAITSGVYLLGGLEVGAAYAVDTSQGLILIDSGLQVGATALKSQLTRLGLDWRRVRAVLLTHAHGDHSGGAEHLRDALGATVYAGQGDAAVLRAGGPREAFFSTFYRPYDNPRPTIVDVELKGGESLVFGDVRILALATPGHTPGSICYLMERAGVRALFAGDVISSLRGDPDSHSEYRRPLGTYSAYLPPRFRGDARAYLSSLRALRALPVPDLVLPGHPRDETAPQSPCLSQQAWEKLLDQGIRDMKILLARFKEDGADFLDGNPKILLNDLYYLGNFRGAAVYGFIAASRLFLVDAPGGPGLKKFVETHLHHFGLKPTGPATVLLTSCGAEAIAGLDELVRHCQARVVASSSGLDHIRRSLPTGTVILPAEELPRQGWFKVTPIPLRGRGIAPMAYSMPWAGKTILFSGRIPIRVKEETRRELLSEISESRDAAAHYLASINQLAKYKPDLWLPAVVTDGRNANLYEHNWENILDENSVAGNSALNLPR